MRLRFGDFVVDSDTRQVVRDQEEIHLSPKAFDLLCTLAERRPTVVDKAELVTRIWPDTFVGDANLNVLIGEIRRALGDTAQRPRFIRTVHGVGYAFCGEADRAASAGHRTAACARRGVGWSGTIAHSRWRRGQRHRPRSRVRDLARRGWRIAPARAHPCGRRASSHDLEDLNSTNGTFVGDAQLSAKHALADGDVIHIGSVALTFRAWFPETSRETERIRRTPRGK